MLKFLSISCLLFILGLSLLITTLPTWVQYYSPRVSDRYFEFPQQTPKKRHPLPSPDPPSDLHLPKLVWWTENFTPETGRELVQCSTGDCRVGGFRETGSADAIMFYGTEFNPYDLPLPRNPDLLWSLFHEESPLNSYHLCTPDIIRLFNFTCTSSRYSDLPLSTMHLSHTSQLSYLPPIKTRDKNLLQQQEGLSPVVYVQSHCSVPSYRDRLVTELMEHIQIDSYGKCLHNKDLPPILSSPVDSMFSSEFYQILSNYKFILTFENAIGYDYISEKIFRAFELGVVPVYYGSGTVSDWSPAPYSVIEVKNFESMQLLAEYLNMLNHNDTAYDEYLRYKQPGGIVNQLLLHSVKHQPFTSMYYDVQMKVIIQRVLRASASVDGQVVSSIGRGLCLLLGINKNDTAQEIEYIVNKVLNLRLFDDASGKKWDVSVRDSGLELLCLSQFTLCCVLKGNKPDFHQAMPGEHSRTMFEDCVKRFRQLYAPEPVKAGVFGAYSHILIENDGPVTIDLESPILPPSKERKEPGSSKQKVKVSSTPQPVNTTSPETGTPKEIEEKPKDAQIEDNSISELSDDHPTQADQ